jgi:PIN domain nuclease of toxin-antitoxin system
VSNYLIDTHTAFWLLNDDTSLSSRANRIIHDLSNSIHLSIASVWELAIKINIGKLNFNGKITGFMRLARTNKINLLPIEPAHLQIYENLPLIHRDPFDRLLVATAIAEEMILITSDKDIALYDVPHVW